jgi:hypothetical protein
MVQAMFPYNILLSPLAFAMLAACANMGAQGQWGGISFHPILNFSIDVSAETLANFTLFSEYSAAATCEANFDSQWKRVMCNPGVCPTLEQTDTTIITGFKKYDTCHAGVESQAKIT